MERLISIKDVADLTALSVSHLYKRTSAGTIPYYKVGKRVLFRQTEIDGWLETLKGEDQMQREPRKPINRNPEGSGARHDPN
jgi:excisionase family DNA binding protein